MDALNGGASQAAFQPDHFFLSRTEGRGVVRGPGGRVIDHCAVTTHGAWDHGYGALHFDETFTFASGPVDVLHWTFGPDRSGRMSASEASVTAPVRGWTDGLDYRMRFKRKGSGGAARLTLLYDVRFVLMADDLAMKIARLKLMGVTVAEMIAFHRRLDV